MKIMLVTDAPWTSSGYAHLGLGLARRLKADGHEPVFFSAGGAAGDRIPFEDMWVLPAAWRDDRWGNNSYQQWMATENPDLVITFLDAQGLQVWGNDPTPWWAWAPIDTWPIPTSELGILGRADKVLVPSQWGTNVARDANLDAQYLPYAIESAEVAFDPEGRKRFRDKLGIGDDIFLVGMVGINYVHPDRKGFQFAFEALHDLHMRHPDNVRGWLHTSFAADGSMDLNALRHELDLDEVLGITTTPLVGYSSQQDMRDMFSAFDCLLQSSMTEGFGMPVIEAQINGCPVVVNGGTALTELAGHYSSVAEPLGHLWIETVTRISLPSVPNLARLLDVQYQEWLQSGTRAHAKAHTRFGMEFDWDRVYDQYWRPLLASQPKPFSFGDHKVTPENGKLKLQVGCGRVPLDGYVHHDREKHADYVDVAHDLEQFPYPWADNMFASILCTDVLEHLRGNLHTILDEFWRILEPGGFLTICTCQTGSWQMAFDPTHVRGFDLHSFDYWDPDLPWGKSYGMEVGKPWRILRRSLRNGQIEVIMQSRKVEESPPSNGVAGDSAHTSPDREGDPDGRRVGAR